MASRLLFDISGLDLTQKQFSSEDVRRTNPQRHEMEQISGIVHLNPERLQVVGVKHVGEDEFWVRGHIPGRPLLPGVLMLEAAAQVCSFLYRMVLGGDGDRFLGFAGLEGVKFRSMVTPGQTLYILAEGSDVRPRRAVFRTQGIVDDKPVFEATVIGMPM